MRSIDSASRYDRQTAIFIRLPGSPCPSSDTFPRLASILITRGGASRSSIWTEDGSTNCSLAGSRLPDRRARHRLSCPPQACKGRRGSLIPPFLKVNSGLDNRAVVYAVQGSEQSELAVCRVLDPVHFTGHCHCRPSLKSRQLLMGVLDFPTDPD